MEISPAAIVSPHAKIADNVKIGPYCIVEDDVEIGDGTVLDSHVVVKRFTTLGKNNHLYMGVVLGSDPEDKNFSGVRSYLRIGDGNVFRENSSASRGTPLDSTTVIGDGNYIMIGVHIAHNCTIGSNIVMCNNCSLGGYVEIGNGAFLSAGVLVHQYSKVGRLAMVSGNTRINLDAPPFFTVSGFSVKAKGLNLVGLRRAGFDKDSIRQLKQAYRILYRSQLQLKDALAKIETETTGEEVRQLVSFIRSSKRGICRDSLGRRSASISNEVED